MRILWIDIDSLRADRLGCYGYQRPTSPHIDALAAAGRRYDNCYVSDLPCLPSRSACFGGRFGITSGVVSHGGPRAEPFAEPRQRMMHGVWQDRSLPMQLRRAGYRTATVSSFADRHGAGHWLLGFQDVHDPGGAGHETLDAVLPPALGWLDQHARSQDWFLHCNLWDVHVPYRSGLHFADDPPDLAERWRLLQRDQDRPGGRAPAKAMNRSKRQGEKPEQPLTLQTQDECRRLLNGYDSAIHAVDAAIGRLLAALDQHGVREETCIIVSADHGECFGELGTWSSHCDASPATARVPFIVRLPASVSSRPVVDDDRHYQLDLAASVIDLAGGTVPEDWHGRSHAAAIRASAPAEGRSHVVCSQLAQACQRAVVFGDCDDQRCALFTEHTMRHDWPATQLFAPGADPRLEHDLSAKQPERVAEARCLLDAFIAEHTGPHGDPLAEVSAGKP